MNYAGHHHCKLETNYTNEAGHCDILGLNLISKGEAMSSETVEGC